MNEGRKPSEKDVVLEGSAGDDRNEALVEQGVIPLGYDFDDSRQALNYHWETIEQVYDRTVKSGAEIIAGKRGGNFASRGSNGECWFCSKLEKGGTGEYPIVKREVEGSTEVKQAE